MGKGSVKITPAQEKVSETPSGEVVRRVEERKMIEGGGGLPLMQVSERKWVGQCTRTHRSAPSPLHNSWPADLSHALYYGNGSPYDPPSRVQHVLRDSLILYYRTEYNINRIFPNAKRSSNIIRISLFMILICVMYAFWILILLTVDGRGLHRWSYET